MKPAVVLICLAGLLVGCASEKAAGPTPLPPVTGTPTASAPAQSAPPPSALPVVPKPADADAFTSEGAASFVRYYVDVINQAIHTNDVRRLVALSATECEGCQNYIQSVRDTVSVNGHVDDGGIVVLDAVAPAIEANETTVLMDFRTTEYLRLAADGRELTRIAATPKAVAELRCVRKGASWLIMGFRLSPLGSS